MQIILLELTCYIRQMNFFLRKKTNLFGSMYAFDFLWNDYLLACESNLKYGGFVVILDSNYFVQLQIFLAFIKL